MEKIRFNKIATFQYTSEATILKGKLNSEGIDVFMRDNNIIEANPFYSNAVGGVKLFVREEDFERTQNILTEISRYSLDDNLTLIKCPQCQSQEIEMVTSIKDTKSLLSYAVSLLMTSLPFYVKYKYKCNKCKFEFNKP